MNRYTPAPRAKEALSSPSQQSTLIEMLRTLKPQIANGLPKHLNPDRMIRLFITEVRKNPKLAECDTTSFFGAVFVCSQLGLEPGSALGHAYLLPYRNKGKMEVQLIIGYQGMIDLAERSGRLTLESNVVYEKDLFEYTLGLNPTIKHEPYFGKDDPGEIIGAYSIARYKDGRYKFRVISAREIEETRKSSKSGKSDYSPWATHYAEMARKTAIRKLFKLLPKTTDLALVQTLDNKEELNQSQNLKSVKSMDMSDIDIDLDIVQPEEVKADDKKPEVVPPS